MAVTREEREAAVGLGLRVAVASASALILAELFRLPDAALAVYTAHVVMAHFTYTSFQQGVERLAGRTLGIGVGLVLITLFIGSEVPYLAGLVLGLFVFSYVFAAGRLGYSALNAALFLGFMGHIGMVDPASGPALAGSIVTQLVLGTGLAFLVNALTRVELTATIVTGTGPLWPPRRGWLSKAVRLTVTETLAILLVLWTALPPIPTIISAALLATTPDGQALRKKALERGAAVFLGGGYALAAIVLLTRMPSFPLFVLLVFLGMFLAAYFVRTLPERFYIPYQAGLVLPMVLVGPPGELGSLLPALQRLGGIVAGLVLAEVVLLVWPTTPVPA
jgi:uncharacterized membrane protein YccC